MAVESAADRAVFLSVDDFGTAVTYTPAGGSAASINGVFDSDFVEVDAGGAVSFAQNQAQLTCRTADVSSAAEGDAVTISGTDYTVRVVQDDGTGFTVMVLEKD